jgi:hypothetical protein
MLLACSYKFCVLHWAMWYAKSLPTSVQDSYDSCTKTRWPSSTHQHCCGQARKNWRITRFPPSSVLLRCGVVPCQWGCKQVQLQDLGQSKSTRHMQAGERQPQSEHVGRLNTQIVDWTVFIFGKDCDQMSYLDMVELNALPQLPPQIILQEDGALPHFCHHVRNPWTERWLWDGSAWAPRSTDLTPLNFFCEVT